MKDDIRINSEEIELTEIPGYMALVDAQRSNVLTVDKIRSSVSLIRDEVEKELAEFKETPQTWLGLISLFIPFLGMIRKWYQDQRRVYLQARLKNLTLISNIFNNSEMIQKKLEEQMNSLKESQQKYTDERRWMK